MRRSGLSDTPWGVGIVAAVAIIAAVVGAQSANAPVGPTTGPPVLDALRADAPVRVSDSSETRLVDIPLDRSLARYVEQPSPPAFPLDGGVSWAESLGPHYGWTLWLARSADREQRCILLERAQKTYARCQPDGGFLAGDLHVSVPYGHVRAGLSSGGDDRGSASHLPLDRRARGDHRARSGRHHATSATETDELAHGA